MRAIFVGYRRWSYQILTNLLKIKNRSWVVSCLLTTTDPEFRLTNIQIPVESIDPKMYGENDYVRLINRFRPDVFLFYGWSWMIPKSVYTEFPCLVLHTSPLPKYRGGSPLQHQIMAGEATSAITIFKADAGIDTGDIYTQTLFSLEGTIAQIFLRIVKAGTKDTISVLNGINTMKLTPKPQNLGLGTYYKRRRPEESELILSDFQTKTARELYNFIRALADPYPNAFIKCKDGKKLFFSNAACER